MVTEKTTMSLSSKKEYLRNVHGRYQRAGREHKSRILDEFCANCGYHRKFALRLLNRPLQPSRRRPGPKPKYDPAQLLPPLKTIWLSAEQPCSKLLKATLPLWLEFLPELSPAIRRDLLAMSAATLDRLLKPVRFAHRRRGLLRDSTRKTSASSHSFARRAAGDFQARPHRSRYCRSLRRFRGGRFCLQPHLYRCLHRLDRNPRHLEQERAGHYRTTQRHRRQTAF